MTEIGHTHATGGALCLKHSVGLHKQNKEKHCRAAAQGQEYTMLPLNWKISVYESGRQPRGLRLEIVEYHLWCVCLCVCVCVCVSAQIGGPENCKIHRLRFLWFVDSKP